MTTCRPMALPRARGLASADLIDVALHFVPAGWPLHQQRECAFPSIVTLLGKATEY
jgi:hypothetical protein